MKLIPPASFPLILWGLAMVLPLGADAAAAAPNTEHKRTELRQALQPNPEVHPARQGARELTPAERREMRELLRQLSRDPGRTPP